MKTTCHKSFRIRLLALTLSSFLGLLATAAAAATTYTWTQLVGGNASGTWGAATNWNNGAGPVADGTDNTADFTTLDLTAASTVTLDGNRTIGNLLFGDMSPSDNWNLTTGSGGTLSLDVTAGSPTITAVNGSNTIAAVIASGTGLTKAGDGTLRLNAANPNLSNLVIVASGILQIGNATAAGAPGNQNSMNRVICTNGSTLQIIAGIGPINKHLTLAGTGIGGTQGALYAVPGNNNSTRWGESSLNDSGASVNSSAAFPGITLAGDTTIRADGDYVAQPGSSFNLGHVTGAATLTTTGGARIVFDRGVSLITNIIIQAGAVVPNQANACLSVQNWAVASGAAIQNDQQNCFSSTANFQIDTGGLVDLNWRGNGTVGSDANSLQQSIGYLNGAGTLTTGSRGSTGTQTLTIQGTDSNSVFNGTITTANGTLKLVKSGPNTLTLNGNNSYNGVTTLNAGTLVLNGTNTGLGGCLLNAGVLSGTGTLSSAITNMGGTIAPGDPANSGGTMTVLSNIIGSYGDTIELSNATLAVSGIIGPDYQVVGTLHMTNATLDLPLRTVGASAFVAALNVDGHSQIRFNIATPLLGQFPIISYTSLGGLAGFAGLSLVAPPGITATLSNNTANSTIDVVITRIPALTWTGTPDGIWNIGSVNWQGGVAYTEPGGVGPSVVFDDTAPGATTVQLATALSPQGVTVNNSSLDYTFSGNGKLRGATGIAKQGSGTLTVVTSGNDFTGGVSLKQGTLQVGSGGTAGDLGSGPIANQGTLVLNRSDSFALPNTLSGNGAITKDGAGTVTVPVSGDSSGAVTVNGGRLLLGSGGTSKFSGGVTGSGAFGVNGPGTLVLSGFNNSYGGGTIIDSGTLQFGDEFGAGALPPPGNIADNGTLAITVFGTVANNISGSGGLSVINNPMLTLSGANTYAGPTVVLSSSLDATTAASWSAGSVLVLGSQNGGADIGTANFDAGDPVLGGLQAGGNNFATSTVNLTAGNQILSILGNLVVGNSGPAGAKVGLAVTGTGSSILLSTNGGTIQVGLGATGTGVNPDNVVVDFSAVASFTADLGTTGSVSLGTLDGNPGPQAGTTVVNQFILAAVSNSISAGTVTIGAGGRGLVPELRLGAGTNLINANALNLGTGGRDGGSLLFDTAMGGVRVRAYDGVSRVSMNVGVNTSTGTSGSVVNSVDLTAHNADLLLGKLVIGNYPVRNGAYQNTFSFDQGVLDALSTSLSAGRNATSPGLSTLNIGGGIVNLGPVSLTASAAAGTLNVTGGTVTVAGITDTGTGTSTLDISGATLNADIPGFGNPATAPISVDVFNASGTVNLGINGTGLSVGQFPLIQYTGSIGGMGFAALNLASLPTGVTASLLDDTANHSVDLVISAAPPALNPNPGPIQFSFAGGLLTLSWPTNMGWTLQAQTNSPGVGLGTNWVNVPGSTTITNVVVPVNPANGSVFYRLRLLQ